MQSMADNSAPTSRRKYLIALGGMAAIAGCAGDDGDDPGDDDGGADDGDDSAAPGDDSDDTMDPSDDSDDGTQPSDDDTDLGDDENGVDPDEVEAAIGDLVEGDNLHLVVEDLTRTTQIGEFQEADPGNEFLIVQLAIRNVSGDFLTVSNLLQTRVRDDEDYSYDQAFAVTDDPTFNDGQFAPGELERGTIVFEVPDDATGLTLTFDFDFSIFGGIERAEIDLGSENDVHQLTQDLDVDIQQIGSAVTHSHVTVEVQDVEFEGALSDFTQPDEGNEYAIVDISVTNETGEEQWISTIIQMLCKSDDGWSYQEDFGAAVELSRSFDEGSPLADGETRAGKVAYEIEEGLSPLYWVFEFDLWTEGDKTFWELR